MITFFCFFVFLSSLASIQISKIVELNSGLICFTISLGTNFIKNKIFISWDLENFL